MYVRPPTQRGNDDRIKETVTKKDTAKVNLLVQLTFVFEKLFWSNVKTLLHCPSKYFSRTYSEKLNPNTIQEKYEPLMTYTQNGEF